MSIKEILRKEVPTFELFMLRRGTAVDVIFSIILHFFTAAFVWIPMELLSGIFGTSALIMLIQFILIFPLGNRISTYSLSCSLNFMKSAQMTDHERRQILDRMHRYPVKKALQTFICFLIELVMILSSYMIFFHVSFKVCIYMFSIGTIISYFAAMWAYYISDEECSELGKTIIQKGIEHSAQSNRRPYAISLMRLFTIYQIIPLILVSICIYITINFSRTFITIHENGYIAEQLLTAKELQGNFIKTIPDSSDSMFRLITVMAISLTVFMSLTKTFYSRVRRNISQIEETLSYINAKNISKAALFPVDLTTEISYTMLLLNMAIVKFRQIMKNTWTINSEIKESSEALSAISKETEETVYNQTSCVEQILATMNSTDSVSSSIQLKLDEVTNVAEKTLDDVQTSFRNFNLNLSKIQEITDSNQYTINGIQTLINKISSIWDIVNLIDSMAEQTKIIAFNAELVANGMKDSNFKNVASEIRNLANSVMNLTQQIRNKILEIQNASRVLINSGKNCMKKIEEENALSSLLQDKFNTIMKSASITAEDSSDIKNAILSQISAFKIILESMNKVYETIKSFTASSADIGETIDVLRSNSQHIENLIPQENAK